MSCPLSVAGAGGAARADSAGAQRCAARRRSSRSCPAPECRAISARSPAERTGRFSISASSARPRPERWCRAGTRQQRVEQHARRRIGSHRRRGRVEHAKCRTARTEPSMRVCDRRCGVASKARWALSTSLTSTCSSSRARFSSSTLIFWRPPRWRSSLSRWRSTSALLPTLFEMRAMRRVQVGAQLGRLRPLRPGTADGCAPSAGPSRPASLRPSPAWRAGSAPAGCWPRPGDSATAPLRHRARASWPRSTAPAPPPAGPTVRSGATARRRPGCCRG